MPYHHEIVESPRRTDFEPATHRKWHTMTTLVEFEGKKIAGRLIVPLVLVEPEPGDYDRALASYLIGRSWQGGRLQVPEWTWIKTPGPLVVEESIHSETLVVGELPVRARTFECRFRRIRGWRDVGRANAEHPILGPMTVKVLPRLVNQGGKMRFESESV